jgi:acetyltransferase-like isoleucine patch superfamily enzyme
MIILSSRHQVRSILASIRAHFIFRGKNIRKEASVKLFGTVWLKHEGSLHIGARCCFHAGPQATEITTQPGGSIEIGDETMVNYGCILNASKKIVLGKRCRLGYGAVILDSHLHEIMPHRRHLRPEAHPVILGDDVWIGTRAIVLAGVRIGYGSVVAAGSIVTKDVPPLTLVAGAPAQPVRRLDSLDSSQDEAITKCAMQNVEIHRPKRSMPYLQLVPK